MTTRLLCAAAAMAAWVAGTAVADGPVPANPFHGIQDREEVFEFAAAPAVQRQGDKWVITFTTKAACDATVAIVDADGRVVRHLASGVLGKNAPHPFQQGSLSQKLEWDGQADDFKAVPAEGVYKVRVSLGLGAKMDQSLRYDPQNVADGSDGRGAQVLQAVGADGNTYVGYAERGTLHGKVFDKEGKYVRTFLPPPAAGAEATAKELGIQLATTDWKEKVMFGPWFGPLYFQGADVQSKLSKAVALASGAEPKAVARPAGLNAGQKYGKMSRLTADPVRDEIYYWGQRLNATTGEPDPTWFGGKGLDKTSDVRIGPDGLVYLRVHHHGYGKWLIRLDHDGKPAPFKEGVPLPTKDPKLAYYEVPSAFHGKDLTGLWTGVHGHTMTHNAGFYVAANGDICAIIWEVDAKWAAEHGINAKIRGPEIVGSYLVVWDRDGKLRSANAVGETHHGHGVGMDREGNVYIVFAYVFPSGQKRLDGIADTVVRHRLQGGHGSLIKFNGLGGQYPLGGWCAKDAAGAVPVAIGPNADKGAWINGPLWLYGGITNQCEAACSCMNSRFDMDPFARSWIPANQLYSLIVLDANGNRVARIGRYGNVDDEGIRFAWPRAVAVNDSAVFVADHGNRRILRANVTYAAEQTVALP